MKPAKPSRSSFHRIRGLHYHVRRWGPPEGPPLFLLHGWMDVSASFQFLVDALEGPWQCIAPDWRGFGLSGWDEGDYRFADYLGDLDALLDLYADGVPAPLLGHSMGGNIACLYAGVRPERVSHVVSLEGFGLPASCPEEAPGRYRRWLDELKTPAAFSEYASLEAVAARLRKNNPRLTEEQARFLAPHWARPEPDGRVRLVSDPKHKRVNPVLYRLEEAIACWRRIKAPVLWVLGEESALAHQYRNAPEEFERRSAAIARLRVEILANAGHMMHHDQPRALARRVEAFLMES